MKTGLAGIGRNGEWTVDLDEVVGSDAYGITIRHPTFYIQLSGVLIEMADRLRRFLDSSRTNEVLHFHRAFAGEVLFTDHDGGLTVRVLQDLSESDANLVEIHFEPDERHRLSSALKEAIDDATDVP